ncbi:MAG: GatB/YqeY domain-containing protein [Chloroflexi bacterium]|nr:GatB/YqeY domain-containing protein [Chloroflexota bacterium]MDA1218333.1 GatB/YqeY domain-containing protein [Chloroflexota bacterium]
MTIRERLEDDIRSAMRSRDQERLDALRFIKSQIQITEKNQLRELDEPGMIEVIAKQAKERRESIQMFQEGNRTDLVAKETAALAVVEEYLPPQMIRDDLVKIVAEAIQQVGATSSRDKGKVMGRLMPQVRGKADGALVNAVVTELLEKAENS